MTTNSDKTAASVATLVYDTLRQISRWGGSITDLDRRGDREVTLTVEGQQLCVRVIVPKVAVTEKEG